jgi:hypothetical protein
MKIVTVTQTELNPSGSDSVKFISRVENNLGDITGCTGTNFMTNTICLRSCGNSVKLDLGDINVDKLIEHLEAIKAMRAEYKVQDYS